MGKPITPHTRRRASWLMRLGVAVTLLWSGLMAWAAPLQTGASGPVSIQYFPVGPIYEYR